MVWLWRRKINTLFLSTMVIFSLNKNNSLSFCLHSFFFFLFPEHALVPLYLIGKLILIQGLESCLSYPLVCIPVQVTPLTYYFSERVYNILYPGLPGYVGFYMFKDNKFSTWPEPVVEIIQSLLRIRNGT